MKPPRPVSAAPRVITRALVPVLAAVALAACAPDADGASAELDTATATPVSARADAAPPETSAPEAAAGTVGGDGSDIVLEVLTVQELGGAGLEGELACSFSEDGAEGPLLHAMGVVASDAPALGLVKVAGYMEPIRAPGGFDGMTRNPTFTGQGKTIRIVETGPAIGGGESPPRPATLTYLRADGASRTFDGQWQCGP
ncbi:hypothetical protein ACF3M1_01525 [Luteimonas sp. WGS1318]|uniref:hypothetical protein n=1 Tax=Luteimonas sp. WGS1318 TaxID=3366815 RepID=UPI00372D0A91